MANQLYGYVPSYAAATPSASTTATVYGTAASRALSLTDRYLTSSDTLKSSTAYLTASNLYSYTSATQASSLLPPGFDVSSTLATEPLLPPGIKRSSEALYYPTVMAAHNVIGQTEDWYSTSPLLKRLKLESASNLSIYPQRPGEKDCAHYMLTRTCKFGDSCKFDHPIWVPEGGIPDWKEVPAAAVSELLPERPGEPDCPYFLKTQRCKFGSKCKFNHPKDQAATLGGNADVSVLPERPSEPECAFYMKTGKCKFGANCKFHHPKDIQIPANTLSTGEHTELIAKIEAATAVVKPALYHNSKGLPVRPGEVDCPFYLKTGSCKYGASCRYNHPDRTAFDSLAAVANPIVASPATTLNIGVGHPATSIYQTIDPRLGQSTIIPTLGVTASVYPQRPGQTECDYYMKTGVCKFGERCKFHHPVDRSAPLGKQASQTAVKLTPAGLPRREGAVHCPYYMKTGTCKFGATCKFDHPPPGEAVAMAATQGASTVVGAEPEGEANGEAEVKGRDADDDKA